MSSENLAIDEYIELYEKVTGNKVITKGNEVKALCFNHAEKTPSLHIGMKNGKARAHCFGACSCSWDGADLVQACHVGGIKTKFEALCYVKDMFPNSVELTPAEETRYKQNKDFRSKSMSFSDKVKKSFDYMFIKTLGNNWEYETFYLFYDLLNNLEGEESHKPLYLKVRAKDKEKNDKVIRYGYVYKNGEVRFKTEPLYDEEGKPKPLMKDGKPVMNNYGKPEYIRQEKPKDTPFFIRPFKFKEALEEGKTLIIVEGEKDVINLTEYLEKHGISKKYCVCSFKGVEAGELVKYANVIKEANEKLRAQDKENEPIKRVSVYVIPDTSQTTYDEEGNKILGAGETYFLNMQKAFKNVCHSFKKIIIPYLNVDSMGDNKDISDWIEARGNIKLFKKALKNSPDLNNPFNNEMGIYEDREGTKAVKYKKDKDGNLILDTKGELLGRFHTLNVVDVENLRTGACERRITIQSLISEEEEPFIKTIPSEEYNSPTDHNKVFGKARFSTRQAKHFDEYLDWQQYTFMGEKMKDNEADEFIKDEKTGKYMFIASNGTLDSEGNIFKDLYASKGTKVIPEGRITPAEAKEVIENLFTYPEDGNLLLMNMGMWIETYFTGHKENTYKTGNNTIQMYGLAGVGKTTLIKNVIMPLTLETKYREFNTRQGAFLFDSSMGNTPIIFDELKLSRVKETNRSLYEAFSEVVRACLDFGEATRGTKGMKKNNIFPCRRTLGFTGEEGSLTGEQAIEDRVIKIQHKGSRQGRENKSLTWLRKNEDKVRLFFKEVAIKCMGYTEEEYVEARENIKLMQDKEGNKIITVAEDTKNMRLEFGVISMLLGLKVFQDVCTQFNADLFNFEDMALFVNAEFIKANKQNTTSEDNPIKIIEKMDIIAESQEDFYKIAALDKKDNVYLVPAEFNICYSLAWEKKWLSNCEHVEEQDVYNGLMTLGILEETKNGKPKQFRRKDIYIVNEAGETVKRNSTGTIRPRGYKVNTEVLKEKYNLELNIFTFEGGAEGEGEEPKNVTNIEEERRKRELEQIRRNKKQKETDEKKIKAAANGNNKPSEEPKQESFKGFEGARNKSNDLVAGYMARQKKAQEEEKEVNTPIKEKEILKPDCNIPGDTLTEEEYKKNVEYLKKNRNAVMKIQKCDLFTLDKEGMIIYPANNYTDTEKEAFNNNPTYAEFKDRIQGKEEKPAIWESWGNKKRIEYLTDYLELIPKEKENLIKSFFRDKEERWDIGKYKDKEKELI